jgi:hypothetical protein
MSDAARQSLEKPDMRARAGQLDMAEALAPNFRKRDFNTAFIADDSAVFHPLVLAAQAFPIRYRTENTRAEEAVLLRLESPVVDGLRFGDFTM